MKNLLKEFKDFISKGNLIDLAVAVVIGLAVVALINAIVKGLIMPLIAAIVGKPSFDDLTFTINHSVFLYGTVITALISFLAIAAAVFFLIVKPMNMLEERRKAGADPDVKACPECLTEIPFAARKCSACGSSQTAVA